MPTLDSRLRGNDNFTIIIPKDSTQNLIKYFQDLADRATGSGGRGASFVVASSVLQLPMAMVRGIPVYA